MLIYFTSCCNYFFTASPSYPESFKPSIATAILTHLNHALHRNLQPVNLGPQLNANLLHHQSHMSYSSDTEARAISRIFKDTDPSLTMHKK